MLAGVFAALPLLTSAQPGRIAFAADRSATSYGEIYAVSPDGRVSDLSRSPAADTAPAVSPNGSRVAFASVRGGRLRIYVTGTDGSDLHALSPALATVGPHDGPTAVISWAPDSRRLA